MKKYIPYLHAILLLACSPFTGEGYQQRDNHQHSLIDNLIVNGSNVTRTQNDITFVGINDTVLLMSIYYSLVPISELDSFYLNFKEHEALPPLQIPHHLLTIEQSGFVNMPGNSFESFHFNLLTGYFRRSDGATYYLRRNAGRYPADIYGSLLATFNPERSNWLKSDADVKAYLLEHKEANFYIIWVLLTTDITGLQSSMILNRHIRSKPTISIESL